MGWALPETRPSAALLETDTDTVTVLEAAELAVVPWELPLLLELLLEEAAEEGMEPFLEGGIVVGFPECPLRQEINLRG